eukprot:TRINITY_DN78_c1_g1_i3.p1 TRINITY_DN78_c1_g1~~TRINITY_DN78_c1_g1_i3.p1  ORF type:complete len:778 (+),score=266.11 TRINITY_DN78_c1_g1_i3:65-2335(+)
MLAGDPGGGRRGRRYPGSPPDGSTGRRKRGRGGGDKGTSGLKADMMKTQLCRNWHRGECRFGESCGFAHGEHELVQPDDLPPDADVPPSELQPRACTAATTGPLPNPPPPSPQARSSPLADAAGVSSGYSGRTMGILPSEASMASMSQAWMQQALFAQQQQQMLAQQQGHTPQLMQQAWYGGQPYYWGGLQGMPGQWPLQQFAGAEDVGPDHAARQPHLTPMGALAAEQISRQHSTQRRTSGRRSSGAAESPPPDAPAGQAVAISDNKELMHLVLTERRTKGFVVRLGDEPVVAVPGVGLFGFNYGSFKNAGEKKLQVGCRVDCRLSQTHPPRACSLRLLSERPADMHVVEEQLGSLRLTKNYSGVDFSTDLSPADDPLAFTQPFGGVPKLSPAPQNLLVSRAHSMPVQRHLTPTDRALGVALAEVEVADDGMDSGSATPPSTRHRAVLFPQEAAVTVGAVALLAAVAAEELPPAVSSDAGRILDELLEDCSEDELNRVAPAPAPAPPPDGWTQFVPVPTPAASELEQTGATPRVWELANTLAPMASGFSADARAVLSNTWGGGGATAGVPDWPAQRHAAETPRELMVMRRQLETLFSKGATDDTYGDAWWSLLKVDTPEKRPLPPSLSIRTLLAAFPDLAPVSAGQMGSRTRAYESVVKLMQLQEWPRGCASPAAPSEVAELAVTVLERKTFTGDPAAVTLGDFNAAFESLASTLQQSAPPAQITDPVRKQQTLLRVCDLLCQTLWRAWVPTGGS